MKRCPECRRDYYDDSLLYCLDDGSALLEGPASASGREESQTAILRDTPAPGDAATVNFKESEPAPVAAGRGAPTRGVNPIFIAAALVGICILAFVTYRYWPSRTAASFKNVKLARITTEGAVESATISADGKYIAYTLESSGKRSLWTKNLASDSRVQIVPPVDSPSMFAGAFSPDGSFVYYTRIDEENPRGAAYTVPVLGGSSKKTLQDVSQPVSISPDGKQIAYGRFHLGSPKSDLYVARSDGSQEKLLLSVSEPDFLVGANAGWSPDGRTLAFGYGAKEPGSDADHAKWAMRIATLSLTDGVMKVVGKRAWPYFGGLVWLDDLHVAIVSREEQSISQQIWVSSVVDDEARPITNDLNPFDLLSLAATADHKSLLAVRLDGVAQLWAMPVSDQSQARQVLSRKNVLDGVGGVAWTADGNILFNSTSGQKPGIWSVGQGGNDATPVTDGETDAWMPQASPDGRYIYYCSSVTGIQIWRADGAGAGKRQLTNFEGAPTYSLSPDGSWLVYYPYTGGIYKMPSEGGEATKIVDGEGLIYPQVSPDGKLLAYFYMSETKHPQLVVVNFSDGSRVRNFDLPMSVVPPQLDLLGHQGFHWSPDGSGLVFINTVSGVSNLWRQPLDGGQQKPITSFTEDRIYAFAYSPDGKVIAMSRGHNSPDVVMLSDQTDASF